MAGSLALESSFFLKAGGGRPEFEIRMKRKSSYNQAYQVFGLEKGLLMLNMGHAGSNSQLNGDFSLAGGLLGGGIGRLIGNAIESASEVTMMESESKFTRCSDAELIDLARELKGSLVAKYDEITSISIDAPGFLDVICRGGSVAGIITVKEQTLGKMTWEICDVNSLATAFEFLPAKFEEITRVNAVMENGGTRLVKR